MSTLIIPAARTTSRTARERCKHWPDGVLPPHDQANAAVEWVRRVGILVSDVVRQAVAGKDFEFEDRGEVDLKGFDEPVRAWAVSWGR